MWLTPRTEWKYVGPGLIGGGDELEENAAPTRAKRKKELTGNEILEKLEENESDVSKANTLAATRKGGLNGCTLKNLSLGPILAKKRPFHPPSSLPSIMINTKTLSF